MVTDPTAAPQTSIPPTRRRYDEVDVLRGLAALWVVLSHYLPYWKLYIGPVPIIVPNPWGKYAVWLFFVISGFVIFSTLDRSRSVGEFAVLRVSRLYPTYWATLLFATLVSVVVFGDHLWVAGFLANMTMFQEFMGVTNFDNVYWSLTVELAFYLNAGMLLALRLHRRPQLIVACWLGVAAIWAVTMHTPGEEHRDWLAMLFALDFAPFFAMGIIFYDVTKHGWSPSRAVLVGVAMLVEFLVAGRLGLTVALVVVPLFVLAIRGNLRFLLSRPTLWLGAISYSLYLIHRNLGYSTLSWLHNHGVGPVLALPLTIAGALALATLATNRVEKPAMRWMRAVYAKWKGRSAGAAPE